MQGLGDWERLSTCLDDDMRFILPEMYIANQDLYDKIIGVGYLINDASNLETGLDWIDDHHIDKILRENPSVFVLTKMLIVQLRLPWHEINTEWLVTKEQLEEDKDRLEILETYIFARKLGTNEKARWLLSPQQKQYFEAHRDDFDVIEMKYCVRWKWTEEEMESFLFNPYATKSIVKNVHTYLSE